MSDLESGERSIEHIQREKVYSFRDQFVATWIKSMTYQKRQIKTNICQALFPLVLIVLLFVLQTVVTSILRNSLGEYAEAVESPSLTPKFTTIPTTLTDVQKECGLSRVGASGIPIENQDSRVLYTRSGQAASTLGIYPNLSLASLPGIMSPADLPSAVDLLGGTGILNKIISPGGLLALKNGQTSLPPGVPLGPLLTGFLLGQYPLAFKGLFIPAQGQRVDICYAEPYVVEPNFIEVSSKEELDTTVFENWAQTIYMAGLDFEEVSNINSPAATLKYSVFYNRSMTRGADAPIFANMIAGSLWRNLVNAVGEFVWAGYKGYPTPRTPVSLDLISIIGPQIYIFVFQLLFPVFLSALVFEKENRLREIMRMMGLKTEIYWLVTYIFFLALYIVATALLYVVAVAMGFRYFAVNSPATLIVFLFVWGNTMIALAFLLSVFIVKTRSATVLGYLILILTGLLCMTIIQPILEEEATSDAVKIGLSVIPPFALFRGLLAFRSSVAGGGLGMTYENLHEYKLDQVFITLAIEWAVCLILAIYFELVIPIGPGVKKHPFFFLPKSCWGRKVAPPKAVREPQDVALERKATLSDEPAVLKAFDLNKVYPGGCRSKDFTAVHNLTMQIKNGECFGFLGPNGAGKSTTINMLSGYLRPSGGTALINGLDIKDDLDKVRLQLGVCPQDNILWDDLTGPEHLYFYGRLKNLRGKQLDDAVAFWLEQVNLTKAKNKYSSEYSGGMKRRLSVAIAMIGNPSIVLLDEPTTGLDPASKQSLWEVINRYKRRCAMLLTTHSMEEAEALCDRLGIFISGRLATIGTAQDLKSRYGSGYRLVITTPAANEEAARDFVMQLIPKANLLNTLAGTQQFEVPRGAIKLSDAFTQIEAAKSQLNILDWGISNTTLEEVFIFITDKLEGGDMEEALLALAEESRKAFEAAQASDDEQDSSEEEINTAKMKEKSSRKKSSKRSSQKKK